MSNVSQVVEESSEDKQKRKRRSYDVGFKMEVIKYAQAHNKTQAAKQFAIHRRCVQTWCKTKDKLEAANSKRMRVGGEQDAAETVEVSIPAITDGEILANLPVTCANMVNDDVTAINAALALAVKITYTNMTKNTFFCILFRKKARQLAPCQMTGIVL